MGLKIEKMVTKIMKNVGCFFFQPGFIVMAAPAVLAMSKLVYPEREESKFKDFSKMKLGQDEEVKSIAG